MLHSPIVGSELIRLVTAGMYDSPLALYREYIQNAADSIAAAPSGTGSVRITIDPFESQINILDNGVGLTPEETVARLTDLGQSLKDPSIDRGFRGIGRLAALAFAEELHFTTRSHSGTPPIRVSWDARTLRELDFTHIDARTAIQKATNATQVTSGEWPERFFQVTIDRINRHAAATILNPDTVRTYLSEVSPVPFSPSFPLAQQICNFLKQHTDYFTFDIRINDTSRQLERPFQAVIPITDRLGTPFETLETYLIPRLETDDPAAVLWLAHTPYAGSIPRRLGIRGLRARAGNIQIGSDRIFEHLFLEPRFNGWCIGEIHVLDTRIVPNGRRDYFEPSPHLRNLENHIGAIAQQISTRCRQASSQRNRLRNINTAISRLEATRDLVRSGYLHPTDATAVIERERPRIPEIRDTIKQIQASEIDSSLDVLVPGEDELQHLPVDNPPAFDAFPPALRAAVQCTFGIIARRLDPDIALDLIQAIFNDLPERLTATDTFPRSSNPRKHSLNNQDGS